MPKERIFTRKQIKQGLGPGRQPSIKEGFNKNSMKYYSRLNAIKKNQNNSITRQDNRSFSDKHPYLTAAYKGLYRAAVPGPIQEVVDLASQAVDAIAGEGTSKSLLDKGLDKGGKVISNILLRKADQDKSNSPEIKDDTTPDNTESESEEPEAKRNRLDSLSQHSDNSNMNALRDNHDEETRDSGMIIDDALYGASSNNAGGAGGTNIPGMGVRGSIERPIGLDKSVMSFRHNYTKEYKLRIRTKPIGYKSYNLVDKQRHTIIYPFHDLPVDHLGFYLSFGEILQLSKFGRVEAKNFKCSAYMTTAVLPFETQSSVAAVGNNNVGVTAVTFKDLSRVRLGEIPNGAPYIRDIFWGNHPSQLADAEQESTNFAPNPPAWIMTRDFDRRYEYEYGKDSMSTQGGSDITDYLCYPSYFPWMNYVKKRWNASITEGWVDHWEYKPKNGYLFGKNTLTLNTMSNIRQDDYNSSYDMVQLRSKHKVNNPNQIRTKNYPDSNTDNWQMKGATVRNNIQNEYTAAEWKSETGSQIKRAGPQIYPLFNEEPTILAYSRKLIDTSANFKEGHDSATNMIIPTFTFGLEPLISHSPSGGFNTNIDAWVEVIIHTSCEIEVNNNPPYLYVGGQVAKDDVFNYPFYKTPQMTNARNVLLEKVGSYDTQLSTEQLQNLSTLPKPDYQGLSTETAYYYKEVVPAVLLQNTANPTPVTPTRRSERLKEKQPYKTTQKPPIVERIKKLNL